MKLQILVFSLAILTCLGAYSGTSEHVIWEKTPIAIQLPLSEERVITFPGPIKLVDSELDEDVGVMKLEDSLYINPKKSFKSKQVVVQMMPLGEVIVLKFSADETYHNARHINVLISEKNVEEEQEDQNGVAPQEQSTVAPSVNPISLTRFAIQSLFAPARLLITLHGVNRVPMRTQKTVALVYGAAVRAHPLISWSGEGLYITAVELKNELNKRIVLDPRKLLGEWQTATFYPTNILNARDRHETTTVFLVSSRPFGEALSALGGYAR